MSDFVVYVVCYILFLFSYSCYFFFFFFSSRRRHTRCLSDWSSDVCSSDLEIGGEEARESVGREVDLLEEQRLAAGQPEAFEVERRRAGLELQGVRDGLAGGFAPRGDDLRLGVQAVILHLAGERLAAAEVQLEPGMEDVRAAPAGPLDAPLTCELREGATNGDQAAAVALGELTFRGQPVVRLPLAGVERRGKVEVDLVVQRDGTDDEPEAGHVPDVVLLKGAALVITL